MGNGKKAYYTPPPGFKKGIDNNGEYSFSTSDASCYISIQTKWINGRSAEKILDEGLQGIKAESCENKNHKTDVTETAWKECIVKVGPRTEGRIWIVICYKGIRNAIDVSVHFSKMTAERMEEIRKSLEAVRWE
jgi:hypothetical protein